MEASERERVNLILNIIGVNSLRLGGLHIDFVVDNSLKIWLAFCIIRFVYLYMEISEPK